MNVEIITLKNGMIIMGETVRENSEKVIVKLPVQLISSMSQGGPTIGFAPFLDYCNEFESGITLSNSDILCIVTPITELYNKYSSIFGSGIQVVQSIKK